jgi:hypothetical protein
MEEERVTTMDTQTPHQPEDLAQPVSIAVIGEAALERLREVTRQMQENIARLLAEEETNPKAEQERC